MEHCTSPEASEGVRKNESSMLSPKLKMIVGAAKLPDDFDEKRELNAYFESKHL